VRRGKYAQEVLILRNLKLVEHFARRFRRAGIPSMDVEDLAHEGVFGLMHAIEKFDLDRGFRLSTYATWWIKQSITRAIANDRNLIRLPVHAFNALARATALEREALDRGESLSDAFVTSQIDITLANLTQLRLAGTDPLWLDDLLVDEWDVVDDDQIEVLVGRIDDHHLLDRVLRVLDGLGYRYRRIIEMRFGLLDGIEMTLEQTGQDIGVTRERVRQLQSRIMDELRGQL